ncbi:MAG TPA: hypothetical protein P5234_11305, partial [Thermoanaerobaculaceae bacterium]|nr:hypothetical protein [Thermoanaerobaculaceae bacterium]HRS16817.1 hypothetical protein [Thermoanaerobaculaceae bacterium]
MALKVFIIGSIPAGVTADVIGEFKATCEGIGETLAGAGHTLMVNKSKEDAADPHIVRGAARAAKRTIVVHENPDYEAFRDAEGQSLVPESSWQRETVAGPREAVFLRTISQADVVLVIGGKYMTALIGYLAAMLEKPVVPIGRFAGAGAELLENFDRQLRDCLSEKALGALRAAWSPATAEALLQALGEITARNPFRTKARLWPVAGLFGAILTTFVLWVGPFLKPELLDWIRLDVATQGSVTVTGRLSVRSVIG